MKFSDLKNKSKVIDSWYWDYGIGVVVKKLKTVVYINFSIKGLLKYDKQHAEHFLKLHKLSRKVL